MDTDLKSVSFFFTMLYKMHSLCIVEFDNRFVTALFLNRCAVAWAQVCLDTLNTNAFL
jgi:hypothetical protein